ncbi:MAG TPA: YqgE/AlgH family protein [Rhodanobacteraceae bacterium]|nr:YqgE/AlgH family protein [Rhodanobacteraceae bacterium]
MTIETDSLSGQLLIAMPAMGDPNFARGVTLLCQHGENGAIGLMINRPSDFRLSEILAQMDIASEREDIDAIPVLIGGPVQPDRGFVLHPGGGEWGSSFAINEHWSITTSRDILEAVAVGQGPEHALVMLGYAGWSPGQLEQELRENAWLTTEAVDAILFSTEVAERWHAATALVGVQSHHLADYAGHA